LHELERFGTLIDQIDVKQRVLSELRGTSHPSTLVPRVFVTIVTPALIDRVTMVTSRHGGRRSASRHNPKRIRHEDVV
jgi:hypothetical protein